MAPFKVTVKHAGKTHEVQLSTDLPPAAFKDAIYQVTGVPVDRMKVMAKGVVIKDDTPWKKVAPKEGQTFTVIGAAGELPKPPEKPIVFLEDMDDAELAEALAKPVGLDNLGNTCYMNATIQALRAIPELQLALNSSGLPPGLPLPNALRNLYKNMSSTTDTVNPDTFLQVLRQVNPQFAQIDRSGKGSIAGLGRYAQQDAEECYSQIINSLRQVPGLSSDSPSSSAQTKTFVEQFLMGQMQRTLTCDESPDEPPSITREEVLKIECNISTTTNYMLPGIKISLDTEVEKNSPTLGREARYSLKSRLTRLPTYLTVHMVRFAWKADIEKKAKIMRRVKFPTEFDTLDLVTDELKAKLVPVNRRLLEIEKDRGERRKIRKRTKGVVGASSSSSGAQTADRDVEMANASGPASVTATAASPSGSTEQAEAVKLEDETVYRAKELAELEGLIHPDLKQDVGSSVSGLYDLVAIITHKGAAADSGHYIGYAKKSVFHKSLVQGSQKAPEHDENDEDWYKFDDDRVSIFPQEKLSTLDGGGEDSSAYVLLYKSKPLA
ncbi:hypothetical protein M378DRAFT_186464 [Amanita muscaria Koide BX008]|uniref:Ubiquitin carboxyl-terminal hydrolase n=1 Tax=Amanita muscaria (strain Koide BX008) TaxID=946122 RepID=A0A0C2X7T6_AMAMK|nr:hypothetical protein M378DRAFT_186464 [Amanita muscaria Koide BX008]